MAYELHLRTGESGLEPTEILGKVAGSLELSIPDGEAPLEVVFMEGGTRAVLREARSETGEGMGADLVLPYGAVIPEVEDCLKKVLEAAGQLSLVIFDPQVGQAVARGDLGRILDRYGEDSSYHVHMAGTAEDSRQGMSSAAEANPYQQPRASVQVKVILGLIGLLFLSWLLFRGCVLSPMISELEAEEASRIPNTGPPPGWIARHPPRLEDSLDSEPEPEPQTDAE